MSARTPAWRRSRRPTEAAHANHPDTHPGDDAEARKFKSVAEAYYDVVGDADKRKQYNEIRSMPGGFGGGFGSAGRLRHQQPAPQPAGGGGFGDMFGDLFGGGRRRPARRRRRPRRAPTSSTTTTIGFADAIQRALTVGTRLTSDAPCPDCSGTGGKPGTNQHICPECEGAGFVVAAWGVVTAPMNETCRRAVAAELRLRRALPDPPTAAAVACPHAPCRPGSQQA